ncbi:MAG: HNH endonuclease [Leptolyngbyaceae cyanobacterium RM2_2_4]|nr:HNH endonuclease [Leptolyngbyaceae cyanobacterium SM1_4_3]NJN90293.1 HNH endonuclease [Leptolyngbyaceae cyanobacterium SL_5_14]NJO52723.1 HNH endonuclease [Leptolyngbyaceae cyanobacterium RM2_2_4]
MVAERANVCCEYCRSQEQYSPDSFSVEHIKPIAKGGTHHLDNLAFSCQGCNNRKYIHIEAIDPATQETAPLYHPRQQNWFEHFAWNEDCSLIIGLTPTGRATVEKLQLNRTGLVNLRCILFEINEHPPNF